jgi:hypothetical protein
MKIITMTAESDDGQALRITADGRTLVEVWPVDPEDATEQAFDIATCIPELLRKAHEAGKAGYPFSAELQEVSFEEFEEFDDEAEATGVPETGYPGYNPKEEEAGIQSMVVACHSCDETGIGNPHVPTACRECRGRGEVKQSG